MTLVNGVLHVVAVLVTSVETELLANGELEIDGDCDEVILDTGDEEVLTVDDTLDVTESCSEILLQCDTEGEELAVAD